MSVEIKIIASGSKANCYRITDGDYALLLEAGLPAKKIKQALNFNLSSIVGCLVTHEHKDHSKGVSGLLQAGIDCYMSAGTAKEIGASGHRLHIVKALESFQIGYWRIMPFSTVHDVAEPLGFLLKSFDNKILFATDTAYLKYTFSGLTHIMLECNYSTKALAQSIKDDPDVMARKRRLINSHFGLDNVLDFLRANDLSKLQEIHLLHLSDRNADEAEIKREVQKVVGVPVYVAGE